MRHLRKITSDPVQKLIDNLFLVARGILLQIFHTDYLYKQIYCASRYIQARYSSSCSSSSQMSLVAELLRKLRIIRRLWNFHIRAVAAAVLIFIAATSPVSSSLVPRLLPPFFFLQLLSSDHPSPPPSSFLQLYCRSRAARKHNYVEFLFSRLFYVQPRISVYLLLPLLAVVVVFYDPVASVKMCKVIRGCERIRPLLFHHYISLTPPGNRWK